MDKNHPNHHKLALPKTAQTKNSSENITPSQRSQKYSILLERKDWGLLSVSKNLSPHVLVISLQRTYTRYNGNSVEGDENARASVSGSPYDSK